MENGKGRFIAFEGIDGSGKSTQLRLFVKRLQEEGIRCHTTMEPSDSPVGSLIHQILTGRVKADKRVIAALFAADRLDHLLNEVNGIAAKVQEGITVVTHRYYFSSYAYHSVDVPMDWVIQTNALSRDILRPTVNLFIDVDPDRAMERILKNRDHVELFEKRSRLVQVREKYQEAFALLEGEENIITVDGNRPPEAVAEEIWEKVSGYFRES